MLTTLLFRTRPELVRPLIFKLSLATYIPLGVLITFLVWLMISMVYQHLSLGVFLVVTVLIVAYLILVVALATRPSSLIKLSPRTYNASTLLTFDEEGMTYRIESGSNGFITWPDFEFARDMKGITMIFQTKYLFHPVPHTAWPSQVERDQFLALLTSKGLLKERNQRG